MMEWHFTPYAIPLFVGAGILVSIAFMSWNRRGTQGAVHLLLLSVLSIFVVVGSAFEIGSTTAGQSPQNVILCNKRFNDRNDA
jgi:lipopolysaccharide export LptBFGC system permease protein LptF